MIPFAVWLLMRVAKKRNLTNLQRFTYGLAIGQLLREESRK